jgi:hypothetical protein
MRRFLVFVLLAFVLGCAGESSNEPAFPGGDPGGQTLGGAAGQAGGADAGGPAGQAGQGGGGQGFACVVSAGMPTEACHAEYDEACSKLAESECSAHDKCVVLSARRVNLELDCVEPDPQVVGCGALGQEPLVTMAKDPTGKTWVFPNASYPLGWTVVSYSVPVPDDCR